MSYSTGNLGRKSILLALLVGGIEQSDLEVDASCSSRAQTTIADVQPACIAAVLEEFAKNSFLKKTAIQHEFLVVNLTWSKSSLLW